MSEAVHDPRPGPPAPTTRSRSAWSRRRSCTAGGTWSSGWTRSSARTAAAARATSWATRAPWRSSPSTTMGGCCSSASGAWPAGRALLEIPAGTLDVHARRHGGPGRRGTPGARGGDRPPRGGVAQAGLVLDGARVRVRAHAPLPGHGPDRRGGRDPALARRGRASSSCAVCRSMRRSRSWTTGAIADAKSILGLFWLDRLRSAGRR